MLTQPKSLKPKKVFFGEIFYIAGGGGGFVFEFYFDIQGDGKINQRFSNIVILGNGEVFLPGDHYVMLKYRLSIRA